MYSNSCCRLFTGGCWIALRVKWAWACGGSYYADGVVSSRHIRWLYASGWFVGEGMSCGWPVHVVAGVAWEQRVLLGC